MRPGRLARLLAAQLAGSSAALKGCSASATPLIQTVSRGTPITLVYGIPSAACTTSRQRVRRNAQRDGLSASETHPPLHAEFTSGACGLIMLRSLLLSPVLPH